MKPTRNLAQTQLEDGSRFSLHEHDGEYSLRINGTQLMTSSLTLSERILAEEACKFREHRTAPRVLIGGLGLGYTLRRLLELVDEKAHVCVAELVPEVVSWNREFLDHLNGSLLDDERVSVSIGDVYDCIIRGGRSNYDAVLLDVDNGPNSPLLNANARLYRQDHLLAIYASLKPGGRLAVWSSGREKQFPQRLRKAGFAPNEIRAKVHERAKRATHWIYSGQRSR